MLKASSSPDLNRERSCLSAILCFEFDMSGLATRYAFIKSFYSVIQFVSGEHTHSPFFILKAKKRQKVTAKMQKSESCFFNSLIANWLSRELFFRYFVPFPLFTRRLAAIPRQSQSPSVRPGPVSIAFIFLPFLMSSKNSSIRYKTTLCGSAYEEKTIRFS